MQSIRRGIVLKTKKLVITVLVVALAAVLVAFYVIQTVPNDEETAIKQLVTDAVDLIEEKGEIAFSEFRKNNSKWFYDDTYVYVWQTDGLRVVYPPDPSGEGQNMTDLTDFEGKEIGKMFIQIALSSEGEGWIEYEWPRPDLSVPASKRTFIKLAVFGEQGYLVGSGYYLETT